MSSTIKSSSLVIIWGVLLALLFLSISIGMMKSSIMATTLIFGIATLKAWLVAGYYMGLKWEPRYVTWILVSALIFMLVLFFYLVPDIIYVYGKI